MKRGKIIWKEINSHLSNAFWNMYDMFLIISIFSENFRWELKKNQWKSKYKFLGQPIIDNQVKSSFQWNQRIQMFEILPFAKWQRQQFYFKLCNNNKLNNHNSTICKKIFLRKMKRKEKLYRIYLLFEMQFHINVNKTNGFLWHKVSQNKKWKTYIQEKIKKNSW